MPPLPNCPWLSRPQHFKSPLSRMAQVCLSPADTATAVRPVPRSIAVVEGALVFVLLPPSPNCPYWSHPQHFMSPLSRMAQVWKYPADTATAVRPVPRSIAVDEGALRLALLPPRPTVHCCPVPNTSTRRCQGWRRCGDIQQKPQRSFVPYRGRLLWMKVRWRTQPIRCPTVRIGPIPNTSNRRCQGWRRCDSLQQTACCLHKQRRVRLKSHYSQ